NVYRSTSGGSYVLLAQNVYSLDYKDSLTSLVYPAGSANPLEAISVQYQVHGVSHDLVEGPVSTNTVTVSDVVPPRLLTASESAAPAPAPANTWVYVLRFSEPITQAR